MKILPFSSKDIRLFQRAIKYIKPYLFRFVLASVCTLSGVVVGLIQPMIWGILLTSIFKNEFESVARNLIFLGIIFIFQLLISFAQQYLFSYLSQNIIYDIKGDMYKRVLELPVKAFDDIRVGEFISRIHGDASAIANILTNQLLNTILDVLRIVIIGIAAFRISVPLSLIIVFAFPLSYLVFTKFGKKLRLKNNELVKINDTYFSNMHQSIFGIREIKSMGITKHAYDTFMQLGKILKQKNISLFSTNILSQNMSQAIGFASNLAIMAGGCYLIFIKALAMEYFIAFTQYSQQFYSSLMNVTRINTDIQQSLTSFERIFGLIDHLDYTPETFGTGKIDSIKGVVEFKNVSFGYVENTPILTDLSFTIPPNKKVAIVGTSGSGKTTIFNLLLKFYRPCAGEIRIDKYNIDEFCEESFKAHISIVRQEPFLFNVSIKENLLLANPSATDSDIYDACKKAYIHDFIVSLPEKYDTVLNETSINLSGGQKQRIAIARAIIKKSKIVLFDEATSSLDNESQYYIRKAIDELAKEHTVLIIAHRLFTIIESDEIIVIDNGKIVGHGSHNHLISSNSTYKHLYETELDILKMSS